MGNTRNLKLGVAGLLVVAIVALLAVIGVQRSNTQAEAESAQDAYAVELQRQQEAEEAERVASEEKAQQDLAARIEQSRALVNGADDLTIAVLGDSTGNERGEWAGLWAEQIADDGATVRLHQWNYIDNVWADSPETIGDGGREVVIWNGSHPGATPDYPLDLTEMLPESAGLVVTNYGHNGATGQMRSAYRQLLDHLAERWPEAPVVVTAQNPARGDQAELTDANRSAVVDLTSDRSLPVIDVHSAFVATDDFEALLTDDVHPNSDGSKLWADTVATFFG